MEALRKGLSEVEEILKKIKDTSKLDYLRNDHPKFSRIILKYGVAPASIYFALLIYSSADKIGIFAYL